METLDADQGWIETRRYSIATEIDWLTARHDWPGRVSIDRVESERHVGEQVTIERRYSLSSLPGDVGLFAKAVRKHGGIENSLYWTRDMAFREDECRVRKDNAPENRAVLRPRTLNLFKQETALKRSIKTKRLNAGWDSAYLLKTLRIAS